ncbi:flavin-containing monooxygenase [Sphingomonas jeddahensis]|uniref:Pentalenolactone D synthase n=1 Tax=Sphingomonas jeddahensis TaxID=1915074 RepID=A0A1V2EV51_9SPHN|nr:NAD(P)/FAD-dependent oxidoreductase [Sphingomonas jeddahensis]ONF96059.1 Pentalenolactone D synthase [Sphingomonas jeddahensis]
MTVSKRQETAPDIDVEALRARYKAERDKRLRTDADRQYNELSGDFARYAEEDPYVEPGFTRAPLTDRVEVAVIGGGFSGMLAAARLKEQGVTELRIIEAGGDFGGTWYWNRYPGAQCDIESYCYLPLLEELGYVPKEKYSYVTEIYEHCQRIGKHYDLYPITLFQTRVSELAWDDADRCWIIRTNHGDAMRARFVVSALGTASRAKLPGIPGIDSFEGHSFHTSRWDYGYTGGDTTGNLWKLADKTVAIIGTGATAIQCIPALGRHAKQLYVFQRTPSSVDTRGNKPTDPEWVKSLQPGWQRARRHNFADIIEGRPFEHDLVNDNWTAIFREVQGFVIRNAKTMGPEAAIAHAEVADFRKMNAIRQRVDDVVEDPATAEKLKPWYRQFCKRPTFNDEFLPTFNRPNVELVDVSESKGVERITPKGLIANGREYEVDCIIYASGFEITTSFKRRVGFDIKGRGGLLLHEHWANGYKTLHGFASHGFPNWFYIGVSQNGLSVNMTAMFDDQAQHIAYIIAEARKRGVTEVEPTPEAQQEWVSTIKKLSVVNRAYLESCTPGYYNNEGDVSGGQAGQTYAPGINAFNALLADWRSQGELRGLSLRV